MSESENRQFESQLEQLAGFELIELDDAIDQLDAVAGDFAGIGEPVNYGKLREVYNLLQETAQRAVALARVVNRAGGDAVLTNKTIEYARRRVRDTLIFFDDDDFVRDEAQPDQKIPMRDLQLDAFFENVVRLQWQNEREHGPESNRLYTSLTSSELVQAAPGFGRLIEDTFPENAQEVAAAQPSPSASIPELEPQTPPELSKLSPEEITAIKKLYERRRLAMPGWLGTETLITLLNNLNQPRNGVAIPLDETIAKGLDVFGGLLQELIRDAELNPDLYRTEFAALGPTAASGAQPRADEIVHIIKEILQKNKNAERGKDNPQFKQWVESLDTTGERFFGLPLTAYLEEIGRKNRDPRYVFNENDLRWLRAVGEKINQLYAPILEQRRTQGDSATQSERLLTRLQLDYLKQWGEVITAAIERAQKDAEKAQADAKTQAEEQAKLEAERDLERERSPSGWVAAYWQFYQAATDRVYKQIQNSVDIDRMAPEIRVFYKRFTEIAPKAFLDQVLADEEALPESERHWTNAKQLIDNVGNAWEYRFDNVKQAYKGLVHKPETISIHVLPFAYREIFQRYGLIDMDRKGRPLLEFNPELERDRPQGFFWKVWDRAVLTSARAYTEAEKTPGSPQYNPGYIFEYGKDPFVANYGKFYDFVIDRVIWTDDSKTQLTPEGEQFMAQFQGDQAAFLPLVRRQIKDMLDIGNLLDEVYAIKAAAGSSINHDPTMLKIDDTDVPLWKIIRPFHGASYDATNNPRKVHQVGNVVMLSEKGIDQLLQPQGLPKNKRDEKLHPTKEKATETGMFIDVSVDADEIIGKIDNPYSFANFAEAVLAYGLTDAPRFFNVDATGWGRIWNRLWQPMSQNMSNHEAKNKIDTWLKEGLGNAKLVGDALTMDELLDVTALYSSRVFLNAHANRYIPKAMAAVGKSLGSVGAWLGLTNATMELQELRKEVVESIATASTVSYLGGGGRYIELFRRKVLEIFGADFKFPNDQLDGLIMDEGMGSRQIAALTERLIKPVSPPLLTATFRPDKIDAYVMYMMKKKQFDNLPAKVDRAKKQAEAAVSTADNYSNSKYVKPPWEDFELPTDDKKH